MIFAKKGQNLVDLALLIGIVGLVVVGMEAYIRRGIQAKVKDVSDYIFGDGQAADPDAPDSKTTHTQLNSTMTSREYDRGSRHFNGVETTTTQYSF